MSTTRTRAVDKGFGLLEFAGKLVPQGAVVTGTKSAWRLAWTTMMKELAPQDAQGAYARPKYAFGGQIGSAKFPAESGRYHLYVGNACPWCHRVLIAIAVLRLQDHISYTWLLDDAERASRGGWVFDRSTGLDPVFGATDLREVYEACSPGFRGRCTAPLLVDKRTQQAVSNDSSIMLDSLYTLPGRLPNCRAIQLRPADKLAELDKLNDFLYQNINNGTYRSGFATTQAAYNTAQADLERGLTYVEDLLSKHRFLLGSAFTDADLRLFPTIVRYDAVYTTLFKCSRFRIKADFPHLHAWMQDVWLLLSQADSPGLQIGDTFNVDAARVSYFGQLFPLNPGGIVPVGPTAGDLGLGVDPKRGSYDMQSLFEWEGAKSSIV